MAKRYVTDSQAVYCLDGLRLAKRYDYSLGKPEWRGGIEVIYKATLQRIEYQRQQERDTTFAAICIELERRNKER